MRFVLEKQIVRRTNPTGCEHAKLFGSPEFLIQAPVRMNHVFGSVVFVAPSMSFIDSESGIHVVTGWDERTQVAQDRSVTHEKRFLLSPVSAMFDQTEFIALRICHHDPFEIVLAQDVGLELTSSQFFHPHNGCLKVGHVEIKVRPVFPLS
jgi:hypothetical protein